MTIESPTISTLNSIVYSGSFDPNENEHLLRRIEELESESRRQEDGTRAGCRRPSIYVEAFEDMINRVHEFEHHLLTGKEWDIFAAFSSLCYNARYCLIRLLLRKPDRWHTKASMETFTREVGEEGLSRALVDLCAPFRSPVKAEETSIEISVKEEPEIYDLTVDCNEEDRKPTVINAEAGPSRLAKQYTPPYIDVKPELDDPNYPGSLSEDPDIDYFCRDQNTMTLIEVLDKLNIEELKDLVKSTKIKPRKMVKNEMVYALMSHASTQSVLAFPTTYQHAKDKRKARDDGLHQTKLPFASNSAKGKGKAGKQTQERRLMEMALAKLGTCLTLNSHFYNLIERINILDGRATLFPKSLLLPALLTCFKKRTYSDYKYTRTSNIWSSREELMQYVAALKLEVTLDQTLESPNQPRGRPGTKTPRPTFVTPGPGRGMATPLRTPRNSSAVRCTETPASVKTETLYEDMAEDVKDNQELVPPETSDKDEKARKIQGIFEKTIIPIWEELVAAKQVEARVRPLGLERFEPGFVYTRLFRRAQEALKRLKDHAREAQLLDALLGQRYWRRRKRGAWYDRRALLQTRYLCREDGVKREHILYEAMAGMREALDDEDTGLVFRPNLLRRLRALEKMLKVPKEDQVHFECDLRKAKDISFSAVRLQKSSASLHLGKNLQPPSGENNGGDVRSYFPVTSPKIQRGSSVAEKENSPEGKPLAQKPGMTGKSLWRGINGEELNVEMRALQHYESQGYKGFHSESRILTMIFALLFWDIIFADIPGAFETPYQSAPLDIAEETFYYARKEMVDRRLEEIKEGQAREILEQHDNAYREKNTWCIGVQWDICAKQDLLEIVECLGGEPLSIICRLFCEDYSGRSSGVPDLVVWNAELHKIIFVEVKGPGDRPQENQKLWFDTLLNAGADVEVCRVLDTNEKTNTASKKRKQRGASRGTSTKPRGKAKPADSDLESENDEEDQFARHLLANSQPSPSSTSKKRIRPPDDDDYILPRPVFLLTNSPVSPLASLSRRRSISLPSKKQKLHK